MRFIASGTHPTARYQERKLFPADRYHGHIGISDPETAISIQNELLHDLALLLAASTSSPFWEADATGLASSRNTVFEALPTGGTPTLVHDWNEFCELVAVLQRAEAITSLKDLWWDIRPSPRYGTIEFGICDGLATTRETAMLVADGHLDGKSRHAAGLRALADGAPTSSERQHAVHAAAGSFDAVCKSLADEFEDDVLSGAGVG